MNFLRPIQQLRQLASSFGPSAWMRRLDDFLAPSLQLAGMPAMPQNEEESSNSLLDWAIFKAAPKSKVSPSRKKMGHVSYFPDKIGWYRCERCGEPKRPHRICMERLDICAMRPAEYEDYLKTKAAQQTPPPIV